ncbi:unnamed protein product, partial [Aphanomyces euteiches]
MDQANEISYLIGTGRVGGLEDEIGIESSDSDNDSGGQDDSRVQTEATANAYIETYLESFQNISCCKRSCMHKALQSPHKTKAIKSLLSQLNPKASNNSPADTSRFRNMFLSIAIPIGMDADVMASAKRQTGKFYLPFLGEVCSTMFCSVIGIHRNKKPTRYRQHVNDTMLLIPPKHKLQDLPGNKRLKRDVSEAVVNYIDKVSKEHGEDGAVTLRKRKISEGMTTVTASSHKCVWLPAYYTRNNMYWLFVKEYCKSHMDQITSLRFLCRTTRSYRFGVADDEFECVFEDQSTHMTIAKELKTAYKADCVTSAIEGGTPVVSFDFAQNLTLPGVHQVPSSFYFMSLLNVYCFGIHNE